VNIKPYIEAYVVKKKAEQGDSLEDDFDYDSD
jgi:hypothetical protein